MNRSIRYEGRNVTNDVTRGTSIRFMCDRRTARTVAAPLLYGVTAEPPRTAQRGSPTKLVVHCSKKFVYSANWQCAHRLGLFCSENGWCTVQTDFFTMPNKRCAVRTGLFYSGTSGALSERSCSIAE